MASTMQPGWRQSAGRRGGKCAVCAYWSTHPGFPTACKIASAAEMRPSTQPVQAGTAWLTLHQNVVTKQRLVMAQGMRVIAMTGCMMDLLHRPSCASVKPLGEVTAGHLQHLACPKPTTAMQCLSTTTKRVRQCTPQHTTKPLTQSTACWSTTSTKPTRAVHEHALDRAATHP